MKDTTRELRNIGIRVHLKLIRMQAPRYPRTHLAHFRSLSSLDTSIICQQKVLYESKLEHLTLVLTDLEDLSARVKARFFPGWASRVPSHQRARIEDSILSNMTTQFEAAREEGTTTKLPTMVCKYWSDLLLEGPPEKEITEEETTEEETIDGETTE